MARWSLEWISNFLPHNIMDPFWNLSKIMLVKGLFTNRALIARFMGPKWGPPGDHRTQVGPMLAPWTLLSEGLTKPVTEYGPVTMILPASGHQVRCIPWVQMGTFNIKIGLLCGLKLFALNILCGEYLQSSLHLMLYGENHYCERCANK